MPYWDAQKWLGGGIPAKDLVGTTCNCNSDAADDAAAYDDWFLIILNQNLRPQTSSFSSNQKACI